MALEMSEMTPGLISIVERHAGEQAQGAVQEPEGETAVKESQPKAEKGDKKKR